MAQPREVFYGLCLICGWRGALCRIPADMDPWAGDWCYAILCPDCQSWYCEESCISDKRCPKLIPIAQETKRQSLEAMARTLREIAATFDIAS